MTVAFADCRASPFQATLDRLHAHSRSRRLGCADCPKRPEPGHRYVAEGIASAVMT